MAPPPAMSIPFIIASLSHSFHVQTIHYNFIITEMRFGNERAQLTFIFMALNWSYEKMSICELKILMRFRINSLYIICFNNLFSCEI